MCRDELCENEPEVEKFVDRVLSTIHPYASVKRNFSDQRSLKRHAEMMQCFEYMAKARLTQTLSFVLARLQAKADELRLSSLLVLRHLVNSLGKCPTSHQTDKQKNQLIFLNSYFLFLFFFPIYLFIFATVVISILPSHNTTRVGKYCCLGLIKVRKALIELIMGMADQGYLTLEGGQNMILFVVIQCAISDREIAAYQGSRPAKKPKPNDDSKSEETKSEENGKSEDTKETTEEVGNDETSPEQIRSGADRILNVMATKVITVHDAMWPYLFQLLIPPKQLQAIGSICKVLAYLAKHKKENADKAFYVRWEKDSFVFMCSFILI
ncbi:hypothetical protein RFI_17830 [Reticulomyxa filosa]|uniref:MROH2B-like HEAT-repeats domain-containing protein n=1 Tax=Reticulomyxa filosa TaxID=46433 RepID=X6N285_RETFI|nr:hypothetical protein RFI_17830 [Reticulomyxa filosa]|eukprot:ETO19397.1 hypothetical protein RFI_17830 [Reticulomyxa filosa]